MDFVESKKDFSKSAFYKKLTIDDVNSFLKGEKTYAEMQGFTNNHLYAMAEVGYQQLEQGKYDNAKTIFLGLSCMNPYDAYFHGVLGAIAGRRGDHKEAIKEYSLSLQLNAKDPNIYVNRGEIYLMEGRLDDALNDFESALKADPSGNHPAVARAQILVKSTTRIIGDIIKERGKTNFRPEDTDKS